MEVRKINLDDWTLAGGGAQGESYFSKTDNSLILKLFNDVTSLKYVEREVAAAKNIAAAGVPCPKIYEVVTANGRYGHIGQRINNKKSFARAAGDDPSMVPDLAARMAKLALKLHGTSSEGHNFRSFNQMLQTILDCHTTMTAEQKVPYEKCLASIPDTHTLLHGDFHFGNFITDGTNDYMIDLGFFGYGDPRHDLATNYFICNRDSEKMANNMFHMTCETARAFWTAFAQEYYGANGSVPSAEEQRRDLMPFVLLRTLVFEYDLGPSPELDVIRGHILDCLPEEFK